jgi:hypothetical protein
MQFDKNKLINDCYSNNITFCSIEELLYLTNDELNKLPTFTKPIRYTISQQLRDLNEFLNIKVLGNEIILGLVLSETKTRFETLTFHYDTVYLIRIVGNRYFKAASSLTNNDSYDSKITVIRNRKILESVLITQSYVSYIGYRNDKYFKYDNKILVKTNENSNKWIYFYSRDFLLSVDPILLLPNNFCLKYGTPKIVEIELLGINIFKLTVSSINFSVYLKHYYYDFEIIINVKKYEYLKFEHTLEIVSMKQ